jgi:hypothetical protein
LRKIYGTVRSSNLRNCSRLEAEPVAPRSDHRHGGGDCPARVLLRWVTGRPSLSVARRILIIAVEFVSRAPLTCARSLRGNNLRADDSAQRDANGRADPAPGGLDAPLDVLVRPPWKIERICEAPGVVLVW